MKYIEIQTEGFIKIIRLNRPEKFNSFNRDMALELIETLHLVEQDAGVRCVVITGNGKAFCAGQDLSEAINPMGPGIERIVNEHYNPIIKIISTLQKPVIAMVNGVAAGAGANIALACDIVLTCESAKFIQAFGKIGLVPDSGGTFTLPRLIGKQRASALMMTGEAVSGIESAKMGLTYKCFKDSEFIVKSMEIAQTLSNMPTAALVATKNLLLQSQNNTLETQLEAEKNAQVSCSKTQDYKEGVQAFLEKRVPQFKGL